MDLEVPGEIPLGELLPELVKLCSSPRASVPGDVHSWVLRFPEGNPLPVNRSLIEADVMDGAALVLQDQQSLARDRARAGQFQPAPIAPSRETGGIGIYWNKDGLMKDN
jgi:hypothetical protein